MSNAPHTSTTAQAAACTMPAHNGDTRSSLINSAHDALHTRWDYAPHAMPSRFIVRVKATDLRPGDVLPVGGGRTRALVDVWMPVHPTGMVRVWMEGADTTHYYPSDTAMDIVIPHPAPQGI